MYREPADLFVARFFCDLNELPGTVRGGMVDTPVGRFAAPGLTDGSAATVAIRPQGIGLSPAGQGMPGRLEQRRFLGVVNLVEVAVPGLDKPLKGRVRASVNASPKSEVGVVIDPAEVLVFAASAA
jgi:iron(III) transport system ATP-binding protein